MIKIVGGCLVLSVILTCPERFAGRGPSVSQFRAAGLKELSLQISNYKSWTRVNPAPLRLPASLAALCAAPTPEERVHTSRNPHRQKLFTVYVNEIGRDAMMREAKPKFPHGSIIVKEKLLGEDGGKVELLTAMIKREPGFNSGSGDWEYLVLDGEGAKVEARGKLENCQSCHSTKRETDYVFRSYLPDDVRRKLR